MIEQCVSTSEPIIFVGAGPLNAGDLAFAKEISTHFIGVDGGTEHLTRAKIAPRAVIGDLDSLSDSQRVAIPEEKLFHVAEQDSTDFEKALMRCSAPLVIGLGFMGARVDHEVAALNVLVRYRHRAVVLLSEREAIFHAPPELTLGLSESDTVSLFPLLATHGRSTGLHWPIDGIAMAPGGRIGTSNRADATQVQLEFDQAGMIVFVPKARLGPVTQALLDCVQARALWPAP